MSKPGVTDPKRIVKALQYSLKGIGAAWKSEAAFRQEVYCAVILIPLALWLGESAVESAFLIFSVLLVLLVEIINSAIEAVVDRVGLDIHELSGRAKDLGSLMVLFSIFIVIIIWGAIFPRRPTTPRWIGR